MNSASDTRLDPYMFKQWIFFVLGLDLFLGRERQEWRVGFWKDWKNKRKKGSVYGVVEGLLVSVGRRRGNEMRGLHILKGTSKLMIKKSKLLIVNFLRFLILELCFPSFLSPFFFFFFLFSFSSRKAYQPRAFPPFSPGMRRNCLWLYVQSINVNQRSSYSDKNMAT